MKLGDFFDPKDIVREGTFLKTMPPKTAEPLSICFAVRSPILKDVLDNPNISAIITTPELAPFVDASRAVVVVENPQLAYYQLHNYLVEHAGVAVHDEQGIHPSAHLASSVVIGKHVIIEEGVVIEHGAMIGDYTIIGAHTYVGHNVSTGVRGMLNTAIAGKSFPLVFAGGVRIGRRCEILTDAVIQRPYQAFYTEIGDDCKISVKAVVGHGVKIGRGTMVAGNAQLSGDVVIGENVWIGPSVTIASAVSIGDRAQVKLGSVVVTDVQPGQQVSGNFATDHVRQLRFHGRLRSGQF